MLHITNGDSVVETFRLTGLPGRMFSWDDVLHEGPTPAGLSLEQMSRVRAQFLASCGWDSVEEISDRLARRDAELGAFQDHEEVVLWFEHDLYDQLQLIQLLDWFSERELGRTRLSLICIDRYLGTLDAAQLEALYPARREVSRAELELGRAAWRAFCSADPTAIEALVSAGSVALPFLDGALRRHLEQFPATTNGLSRTERQILEAVAAGAADRHAIFAACQRMEERVFMGDATFWLHLDWLCRGPRPLLRSQGEVALTADGRAVLDEKSDWIALGGIDRWLGGVHLSAERPLWRWDRAGRKLARSKIL